MGVINQTLEKYSRFLWILVVFNGITEVAVVTSFSLSIPVAVIFLTGLIYLVASYGLFRKKSWGWKLTASAAGLTLFFLLLYPSLPAFFINGIILFSVLTYRKHLTQTQLE